MPNNRVAPVTDVGLSPLLFCHEITGTADGTPLACPQCTGANLHLDTVHFATPTTEHYTPTVGLSIDPDTGASSPTTRPARCTPDRTAARCWPPATTSRHCQRRLPPSPASPRSGCAQPSTQPLRGPSEKVLHLLRFRAPYSALRPCVATRAVYRDTCPDGIGASRVTRARSVSTSGVHLLADLAGQLENSRADRSAWTWARRLTSRSDPAHASVATSTKRAAARSSRVSG
jgi:hypothetical protein